MLRNVEQLSALAPGGINPEPKVSSTAPHNGLKGVEIAGTLVGLTLFEEKLVWVKYIGETSHFSDLQRIFNEATMRNKDIKHWLNAKHLSARSKRQRKHNFRKSREWLLANHLRDYRCITCLGVKKFQGIVCDHCNGTGVNPITANKLAVAMDINPAWCYDSRQILNEARSILIRVETSAITRIAMNNTG